MTNTHQWAREAAHIADTSLSHTRRGKSRNTNAPLKFAVLDLEFVYDRLAHQQYAINDEQSPDKIRWPFCRIVAAAWLPIAFDPQHPAAPIVGELINIGRPEVGEAEIVKSLFAYLEEHPDTAIVTWGGGYKDLAVLSRAAAEYDLCLPKQVRQGWAPEQVHLDLSDAVKGKAIPMHLPEYAASLAIPAKTGLSSKAIGFAAEAGEWDVVCPRAAEDVCTTAILLGRYLASNRLVAASGLACDLAITKSIIATHGHLPFVADHIVKWREGRQAKLTAAATVDIADEE